MQGYGASKCNNIKPGKRAKSNNIKPRDAMI